MHGGGSLWWRVLRAHAYAVLVIGVFLGALPWFVVQVVSGVPLKPSVDWPFSASGYLGLLLAATGGALSYACMLLFVIRGKGTAFPTDPPLVFVPGGPYRCVRNPMYLGNAVLAIGIGLYLSSVPYLLYTGALMVAMNFYVAAIEEPRLAERFGASYEMYRRSTPRWIPRPPRSPLP